MTANTRNPSRRKVHSPKWNMYDAFEDAIALTMNDRRPRYIYWTEKGFAIRLTKVAKIRRYHVSTIIEDAVSILRVGLEYTEIITSRPL